MRSQKSEVGSRKLRWLIIVSALVCLLSLVFAQTEWKQALSGYQFDFSRDHASHPEYKIEWWYYTGNLATADGHRFGYQLTFFRVGVDQQPVNPSRWAVRDLYMAHLAVTDIDGKKFKYAEKLNRAGVGWAGAETDRYRVWNEDWQAQQNEARQTLLKATDEGISIELELEPGKAPVIHGQNGVSQKGSQVGNASHYYSQTRMPTRGTIVMDGQRFEVTGASWMDHEFGTSFLEKEQKGWDWLAIQLEDGTDVMLYQFRRNDGALDLHTSGTIIDANGKATAISAADFTLEPIQKWRSPQTGAEYPTKWIVKIPARNLEFEVRATIENQELITNGSTGVSYWEGAIWVEGKSSGRLVKGRGYLEMTGYAGAAMGTVFD
ncbi:MAG: carotenoid 1,2-hydratase [Acidobacteria bacterium]|nr:carotenoid 1,2-hydratase [Acidobacteriota bacterium]